MGQWLVLISNIADIYSELDQAIEAEEIVPPEIESIIQVNAKTVSSGRHPRTMLAESVTRSETYDDAEEVVSNSKNVLKAITDPNAFAMEACGCFSAVRHCLCSDER
jgi:hypothetical protein